MNLNSDKELGFEISKVRVKEGLSLRQLADKIPGEEKQAYYKKEKGETRLKIDDVKEITKILPISVVLEQGVIKFNEIGRLKINSSNVSYNESDEYDTPESRFSIRKVYKFEESTDLYMDKYSCPSNKSGIAPQEYYAIFDNKWDVLVNDTALFVDEQSAKKYCVDNYYKHFERVDNFEATYDITKTDIDNFLKEMTYEYYMYKCSGGDYFFFDASDIDLEFEEMFMDCPSCMVPHLSEEIIDKYCINVDELWKIEYGKDEDYNKYYHIWERLHFIMSEEDKLKVLKDVGNIIELENGGEVFMHKYKSETKIIKDFVEKHNLTYETYCEIEKCIENYYEGGSLSELHVIRIFEDSCSLWDAQSLIDYLNMDEKHVETIDEVQELYNVYELSNGDYLYI